MGTYAIPLIIAVVILRALFIHRLPKRTFFILWAIVLCRKQGEVGLDHYEMGSYNGWSKHITMAMCAHALLSVFKLIEQGSYHFSHTVEMPKGASDSLTAFKKGRGVL